MRRPPLVLVDGAGQPFSDRVANAVVTWIPRLRAGFPGLDDTARIEVLEEAARRVVRRESGGRELAHLHAYAWTAIRSAAISRTRLGRERMVQLVMAPRRGDGIARVEAMASAATHVEARVLLRQLFDHLTILERRIIRLKAAGFSAREIAGRIGRAPATVDSVYSRALTRLRRVWAGPTRAAIRRSGTAEKRR